MATSLTRRTLLRTAAYGVGAHCCAGVMPMAAFADPGTQGWTAEWDAALLNSEIDRLAASFDEKEQMIRSYRGPEYNYQSNLRSTVAHPTRDSLDYASLLLYQDNPASLQRAIAILKRVLPLQVQDPASRYFGLWSWFLEEPVEKMNSADFNWADFNGSTLLNILFLHEKRLPTEVAAAVRSALRHAAACIRKRNVSLYYTNIAFQGTYVTLAAAELLGDTDLLAYAKERFQRLDAVVNESGSFAEYNSPTYIAVTIENISRILMYVRDPAARVLAEKLNALAWKHIGEHWHAPTMQLAGPMSRAYSNDIGSPMWIQKGTGNRVQFLTLEQLKQHAPGGENTVATVAFRCPDELLPLFAPAPRHQHREVFIAGTTLVDNLEVTKRAPVAPLEGTTWLTPRFALGSANRSDFWIQRRPLIAYWGTPQRPPQCMQMRVVKDDYDFTSALLYSAQNQGSVLGSVRFRSDGGDKHPSLDKIQNGTFSLTRMSLELLFEQWKPGNRILVDGKRLMPDALLGPDAEPIAATSRVAVDAGGVKIFFQARAAHFLEAAAVLRIVRKAESVSICVELMNAAAPQTVHWAECKDAGCDFTLWMDDSTTPLEDLDAAFAATAFHSSQKETVRQIAWHSRDGVLEVKSAAGVQPIAEMDAAYVARLDGKPYPFVRLADAPIRY